MNKYTLGTVALSALLNGPAVAQETHPAEEIIVVGVRDTHTVRTDDTLVAAPDTAQLLRKMPGANINKNGELTGIAQYRGMYGDRIHVSVNGAQISGAGPNAMDAPLHYAPVAILESLTINRGISPVSVGQETIGGYVEAVTYSGDYGLSDEFALNARTYFGLQSVNSGHVSSGFFALSNRSHIFRSFVMREEADDMEFSSGSITPSAYERERYDLGYSYREGNHEFSFDFARNNTGDAGTAALPMDILSIDSDLFRSRYTHSGNDLRITVELSASDNEHWMTNYHMRRPPQDNMMTSGSMLYRQNFAVSESYGGKIQFEQFANNGKWVYGADAHFSTHRSTISNPNSSGFFISNFNDTERDVIGVFLERKLSLSNRTGLEMGARINRVDMDSERISANLNPMNVTAGMPLTMNSMAAVLANTFNNQQLAQTDNNLDWFARLSVEAGRDSTLYIGAARKSRSPSYQQRYLWIPLEATGGLADGKTYIGNPKLDAEVSHEIELGLDYDAAGLAIYPRLFYRKVSDYIQGTPSTNTEANTFAMMMSNMGMGLADPLMFSNVEASFYGFDLESRFELTQRLALRVIASVVRGKRDDINDDLYRISPDNLILALDYRNNNWSVTLESVTYANQNRVSDTNIEQKTDGYSLLNLSGRIHFGKDITVGVGIDNLFDGNYQDHLAAYNRAFNPDIDLRERMPGQGRNVYARLMWDF